MAARKTIANSMFILASKVQGGIRPFTRRGSIFLFTSEKAFDAWAEHVHAITKGFLGDARPFPLVGWRGILDAVSTWKSKGVALVAIDPWGEPDETGFKFNAAPIDDLISGLQKILNEIDPIRLTGRLVPLVQRILALCGPDELVDFAGADPRGRMDRVHTAVKVIRDKWKPPVNVVAAANETMEWVDSFRTAVPGSSIYCPDSRSEAVLDFVQWLEDELRSHDEQVRRRSENN